MIYFSNHWICNQCPTYLLCPSCKSSNKGHHDPNHVYRLVINISTPSNNKDNSSIKYRKEEQGQEETINLKNTNIVHDNVVCDHCGGSIVGIRYKVKKKKKYILIEINL